MSETLYMASTGRKLMACRECDLLVRVGDMRASADHAAHCPRCGAHLYRHRRNGLEHSLALAVAALVLLVVANAFPVVGLNIQGQRIDTTVIGAAMQLWRNDMPVVSVLVLATTSIIPLLEIAAVIWLTLPLRFGRRPPVFAHVFRTLRAAHPWAMVEVFILGILVALVKLAHLAEVLPGAAMFCFGALMLLLTGIATTLEPHALWQAWEEARE